MYHKKAFSLIELLMVIIILGILIAASRTLFTMPSQYIIKSEQCVNSIHWEITRAFYSGISGKFKKVDNTTDTIPEQYSIIFDSSMIDNSVTMLLLLEWATTWTTWKVITLGKESSQAAHKGNHRHRLATLNGHYRHWCCYVRPHALAYMPYSLWWRWQ